MFRKKNDDHYYTYEADEPFEYEDSYVQRNNGNYDHDYNTTNYHDECEYESTSKGKISSKSTKILIVTGVYIVFLIIGIFTTTYTKTIDGKNQAQIISVSLRQEREEYYKLREHYLTLKEIIAEINNIDSQLSKSDSGDIYSFTLKYEDIVPAIKNDMSLAENMPLRSHISLKDLLITVYQDTSNYLTKKSTALTRKDAAMIKDASVLKKTLNENFNQFVEDMKSVSKSVMIDDDNKYNLERVSK